MTDRNQVIRQRRNLLNIIREMEADKMRITRHQEVLMRAVDDIEQEYGLGKYAPLPARPPPIDNDYHLQ